MFPFRSPEQLIIEYTEYLFRTKVEKRVYLDENFVEYVGSYVYGIVKESASLMADMTSRIYNQAILPIVTFTSDTLFQLISSSTDFLADFSKIQMVCIMVLGCLLFGLNKSIRTTRKIKKELKTYKSIMKHVKWQCDMARSDMEEITRRLSKNSESRIPSTLSRMEYLYNMLDTKYQIQHRLDTDSEFWTPLIMAEVKKLDLYNKIWRDGTGVDRVNEIRDLGRHVDIEVARVKSQLETLKESIIEMKNNPNLCFDELAFCNPDGSPIEFFTAAGSFNCTLEFESKEGELNLESTSADPAEVSSWAERVEAAEANEIRSGLTSDDSTKGLSWTERIEADKSNELSSGLTTAGSTEMLSWADRVEAATTEELDFSIRLTWADENEATEKNEKFTNNSQISFADKVDTAETIELNLANEEAKYNNFNGQGEIVEAAKSNELSSGLTSAGSTEMLSWAERVEAATTEELDFSIRLTWADENEATEKNEKFTNNSQISFADKVDTAETIELNLANEEYKYNNFNGQGEIVVAVAKSNELSSGLTSAGSTEMLSWAERVEAATTEELDFSIRLTWADENEATEKNEKFTNNSQISFADKVDTAETIELNLANEEYKYNNFNGQGEIVVAVAKSNELSSGLTSAGSTEMLSWAERVEAATTEELDFSIRLTWADENEATEKNEKFTHNSRMNFADKVDIAEAIELNLANEESKYNNFNGQGDNGDEKLSWADQVDAVYPLED